MNEIFNIRRFGKYLLTDTRMFLSRNLSFIIIFCLVYLLSYIPWSLIVLTFTNTWEGFQVGFRTFLFLICTTVLCISVPTRTYGKVTNRKKGSEWVLVPASALEKTASMILIIVASLLMTVGAYLGMDALICLIDPTCGETIFHSLTTMDIDFQDSFIGSFLVGEESVMNFIGQLMNPFLYIDNLIAFILAFLLGSVLFRRAKALKTILCLMLYGFLAGIVISTTLTIFGYNNADASMNEVFSSFIFSQVSLITTAIDIAVILILCLFIYLRIKTLKH